MTDGGRTVAPSNRHSIFPYVAVSSPASVAPRPPFRPRFTLQSAEMCCLCPPKPPSPSPASNRHHTERRAAKVAVNSQCGSRSGSRPPERSAAAGSAHRPAAAQRPGPSTVPAQKAAGIQQGRGVHSSTPPGCEAAECFRIPSATAQTALQTVIESTIWLQRRDGALLPPQVSTFLP